MSKKVQVKSKNIQNKSKMGNVAVKIVAGCLVLFTVISASASFIYYIVSNIK